MTLKELKIHFQNKLQSIYDEEEIDSFFFMITEKFYTIRRIDFTLNPDFIIENYPEWEAIISNLKQEKPIQYILGEAWFYGLKFKVNENTLIPRSETEELVEWILKELSIINYQLPINILDIGTGTGCIPISLKSNLPEAEVFAIDVSEKALEIANQNAKDNNVEINFIQTDILKTNNLENLLPFTLNPLPKLDIIVSNPPYVRNLEKEEIKKNVLNYEPHLALFVEDNDALLFYRKIAQLAKESLQPNGLLFFEINQYLGQETVGILSQLGYQNIELRKDLKGNDRMIKCTL
ncbi:MAG: peptide chain release factor N(5)-glutamine methyltransferase [Flavobacteriaceae bacterium]|nr:peptide chain release factor N(5)-glutamine methyltransferase [Flavobacteriaceae bacterium]